jgi:outer membrane protein assembly factor BamE (lipoprotein component of BamABCDE complex)
MKSPLVGLFACFALAGCAVNIPRVVSPGMTPVEVSAQAGKPVAEGRFAGAERYWDYTDQPFGYTNYRVTFGSDERVRDVQNLLTEQNLVNLRPGMTAQEVAALVGPSARRHSYWNGTTSWTYRYRDGQIVKLLNVIFDRQGHVLSHYAEWDPAVYSRGGGARSRGHGR